MLNLTDIVGSSDLYLLHSAQQYKVPIESVRILIQQCLLELVPCVWLKFVFKSWAGHKRRWWDADSENVSWEASNSARRFLSYGRCKIWSKADYKVSSGWGTVFSIALQVPKVNGMNSYLLFSVRVYWFSGACLWAVQVFACRAHAVRGEVTARPVVTLRGGWRSHDV